MENQSDSYQGIVLYADRGALQSQIYFASCRKKFDADVTRGTLEGFVLNSPSQSVKVVASKWLDQPVDRTKINKINSRFYDETIQKLMENQRGK